MRRACSRWLPTWKGHPDNVAPALMGGLVISAVAEARDGQRILTHRLAPPPAAIALCIPEQPLATEAGAASVAAARLA